MSGNKTLTAISAICLLKLIRYIEVGRFVRQKCHLYRFKSSFWHRKLARIFVFILLLNIVFSKPIFFHHPTVCYWVFNPLRMPKFHQRTCSLLNWTYEHFNFHAIHNTMLALCETICDFPRECGLNGGWWQHYICIVLYKSTVKHYHIITYLWNENIGPTD